VERENLNISIQPATEEGTSVVKNLKASTASLIYRTNKRELVQRPRRGTASCIYPGLPAVWRLHASLSVTATPTKNLGNNRNPAFLFQLDAKSSILGSKIRECITGTYIGIDDHTDSNPTTVASTITPTRRQRHCCALWARYNNYCASHAVPPRCRNANTCMSHIGVAVAVVADIRVGLDMYSRCDSTPRSTEAINQEAKRIQQGT
jgi:hypothetical protein